MILSDVSQRRFLVNGIETLNHIRRTSELNNKNFNFEIFSYSKVSENLYLATITNTIVGDYHKNVKRDGNLKGIARLDLFDIQEWLKNKNWRNEIMTDEHREVAELIQKYSEEHGLSYVEGLLKAKNILSERMNNLSEEG